MNDSSLDALRQENADLREALARWQDLALELGYRGQPIPGIGERLVGLVVAVRQFLAYVPPPADAQNPIVETAARLSALRAALAAYQDGKQWEPPAVRERRVEIAKNLAAALDLEVKATDDLATRIRNRVLALKRRADPNARHG